MLDFSRFQVSFRTGLRCYIEGKDWIISVTASQK